MTEETTPDYTFGDNAMAGDRLALLAAVFAPSSERVLRIATRRSDQVAVDLGCGPGHTTALLAQVSGATRTIGLDVSESFVDRARRDRSATLEFAVHDVTRTPFPTPSPDLLLRGFLLAHLPDPTTLIAAWCAQLAPGGRFVTVETERIDTSVEPFAIYEATARSMVAHHGANLQVGALTRDLAPPKGTRILHSELVTVEPSTAEAARLYGMNLATWRHDPFIVGSVPPAEIDRLARELADLEHSDAANELTFCNRQVIYERL